MKPIRISMDIGGVLSRAPDVFRAMATALAQSPFVEFYILTDMARDKARAAITAADLNHLLDDDHILIADWNHHGEQCKVVLREQYRIHLHIDDMPMYAASTVIDGDPCLGLLLMPSTLDYNHSDWKT